MAVANHSTHLDVRARKLGSLPENRLQPRLQKHLRTDTGPKRTCQTARTHPASRIRRRNLGLRCFCKSLRQVPASRCSAQPHSPQSLPKESRRHARQDRVQRPGIGRQAEANCPRRTVARNRNPSRAPGMEAKQQSCNAAHLLRRVADHADHTWGGEPDLVCPRTVLDARAELQSPSRQTGNVGGAHAHESQRADSLTCHLRGGAAHARRHRRQQAGDQGQQATICSQSQSTSDRFERAAA